MRVGVDARSLAGHRGVAHYTAALLDALARRAPADRFVCFVAGRDEPSGMPENVEVRRHPLPSRALFAAAALGGRPRVDRLLGGGLDVLWAPAPRPMAISDGVPLVLTLHDLSFEERPGDFTPYERLWHRLARPRRLAARAQAIVVDTDVTREGLVARWRLDRARIHVVAPGVSRPRAAPGPGEVATVRARYGLPERYLLAVGALEPRKAPELLVRAHARARTQGLRSELVFAGAGRLAPRLNRRGVHVLGHVGDAELEALYAGARALVMASWLEGFGLPPLEALVRGVPPLVADLPVYEHTLAAGALRFPAGDELALAAALHAIDTDERLRARLVSAGQPAARRFTTERAADDLHAVLRHAAGR